MFGYFLSWRPDEDAAERAPKRIKLEQADRASESDVTSLKKPPPDCKFSCGPTAHT